MAQVKLGDVAVESRETYKGDKTNMPIVGLEHITPGEVTLSNWNTDTDNTFTKLFRKGDMLFGRRRAYLKKAAQAPFDGICSGDITVIRAKEDLLSPELLPFIIQNDNLFDFAMGKSAGSLSPRVKWDNLKNYSFELPSMDEQRKLAGVLWSINDTLQTYQELLSETDSLVKSQFIEMFGNLKNNPKDYPVKMLSEVADINLGLTHTPKYVDNGKPFLSVKNISSGVINFEGCQQISEQEFNSLPSGARPKVGDVLFCRVGTIGKPSIITEEMPEFGTFVSLGHLRTKGEVTNVYLKTWMESDEFMDQVAMYAVGSSQVNLNTGWLKNFKLLIPPIDQQQQFTRFIKQSDKSKSVLQNTITSLQTTKRCILDDAFGTRRKE